MRTLERANAGLKLSLMLRIEQVFLLSQAAALHINYPELEIGEDFNVQLAAPQVAMNSYTVIFG